MSKRTFFKRYLWLYDLIKNNPYITYDEIEENFFKSDFRDDKEAGFSKRTFIRDKKEITDLFGVEIQYNAQRKGYYIEEEITPSNTSLLVDSYRYINLHNIFKEAESYIAAEPRKSGSNHLLLMLDAIQNRKKIEFSYQKYVDETVQTRTIEPYFVKEFKNRWYVIGKGSNQIKTYALERIINDPVPVSPSASFDIPHNLTPESFFKDSFGIFKLYDDKVEEIELSFKPLKGKFIKSQPLHRSQSIIIDDGNELRIKLKLQVTHDFLMELLSHGNELKVIAPESLRTIIIKNLETTLNQYK